MGLLLSHILYCSIQTTLPFMIVGILQSKCYNFSTETLMVFFLCLVVDFLSACREEWFYIPMQSALLFTHTFTRTHTRIHANRGIYTFNDKQRAAFQKWSKNKMNINWNIMLIAHSGAHSWTMCAMCAMCADHMCVHKIHTHTHTTFKY